MVGKKPNKKHSVAVVTGLVVIGLQKHAKKKNHHQPIPYLVSRIGDSLGTRQRTVCTLTCR